MRQDGAVDKLLPPLERSGLSARGYELMRKDVLMKNQGSDDWLALLDYNAQGLPMNTLSNIALILQHDEGLQNIYYNEMSRLIDVSGEVPWQRHRGGWSNTDFSCLQMYLEKKYRIYAPKKCQDALYAALSCDRRKHPIRDYLDALVWDGYQRLDSLLLDCFEVEDSRYVRAVTRKTLTAAVARIYQPGIKFDHMLVLCGSQGIGKSTLFSKLGGKWYSDSMTIADMKDKTAAEKLQGIWIMELSELAGIRKVDVETVKSFLSRTDDQYRAPYQSYVEPHPRSSILVGTTNASSGFLRDITGNRRFWPVIVHISTGTKPWELTRAETDQIWAEAVTCFRQREPLFLPPELDREAQRIQQEVLELDPRQGLVGDYLDQAGKDKICLMELWCECLHKDRSDFRRTDAYELEGILCQLGGWELYRGNSTGKLRHPGYGIQRTFVREKKGESNA